MIEVTSELVKETHQIYVKVTSVMTEMHRDNSEVTSEISSELTPVKSEVMSEDTPWLDDVSTVVCCRQTKQVFESPQKY